MEPPQLLHLPSSELRISHIKDKNKKDLVLRTGAHRMHVQYNAKMAPALKNIGLYQIARVNDCPIDKSLITALVERWRPETNTFHLPFGEMTVTLEDVSILWGLPIRGEAITGISDDEWSGFVEEYLGIDVMYDYENPENTPWRSKVKMDELTFSKYHIRLAHLRRHFKGKIPDDANDMTVDQWTRAFCMDLFGSIMFPDKTPDSVPCMYLQFLRQLDQPLEYNWGSAVLAYLYRELSNACMANTTSIYGPLLLLQMWSWTRFPIGRPRPAVPPPPLGGPDLSERHAFGVKWTTHHTWPDNTRNGGVSHFRDDFSDLTAGAVNWLAYVEHRNDWNAQVYKDKEYFMSRGALIYFWIVIQHYPDRVMRQYSLYQVVPPPAPEPWEWHQSYNVINHDNGRASTKSRNWGKQHKVMIDSQMIIVEERRPWIDGPHNEYVQWYMLRGMPIVHVTADDQAVLDQPLEDPPQNEVESSSYQPRSFRTARLLYRMIRLTAQGIQWVKTPGQVLYGKLSLKTANGAMDDLGHGLLFRAMMRHANLPEDPRLINVGNDIPGPEPTIDEEENHVEEPDDWEEFERNPGSFTELLLSGIEFEQTPSPPDDRPGPSSPARPRRRHMSLDRLTYSEHHVRKRRR